MMQDRSQNPVGGNYGYTSGSQPSYMQGRSAENPVVELGYESSTHWSMHKQHSRGMHKQHSRGILKQHSRGIHKHSRSKKGRTLPQEATKMLFRWLSEHCLKPFPSEAEKKHFAALTNLTEVQVSNWFINARRRQLPVILQGKGKPVEEVLKRKKRGLQQNKSSTDLLNEQIAELRIANENSRADRENPESNDGMHIDSPWCFEAKPCYCKTCAEKEVKNTLGYMNVSDTAYNICMLSVVSTIVMKRDSSEYE